MEYIEDLEAALIDIIGTDEREVEYTLELCSFINDISEERQFEIKQLMKAVTENYKTRHNLQN